MNWDRVEGNWKKFSGKVREQWGRLTDDDLDVIEGRRETLSGRIQEIYGISQDEAERQIKRFEDSLPDDRSNMQYDDSGTRTGTSRNLGGNPSRDPRDSSRTPSR
jgi:uncharacterized protein YjbJ (UPF0337 family)